MLNCDLSEMMLESSVRRVNGKKNSNTIYIPGFKEEKTRV